MIERICANGRAIPPTYVSKGMYSKLDWRKEDSIRVRSCLSESGYSNSAVMLNWLVDTFQAETKDGAHDGQKRLPLLVSVRRGPGDTITLPQGLKAVRQVTD